MNERLTNERTQAGRTIDTNNRREQMKRKQEADRKAAAAAKAKSKALREQAKTQTKKAAEAKKAAEIKAQQKRADMKKQYQGLNKTVGGTSKFAKSLSKGKVSMKDPMAGKTFNPLGSLFGKKK